MHHQSFHHNIKKKKSSIQKILQKEQSSNQTPIQSTNHGETIIIFCHQFKTTSLIHMPHQQTKPTQQSQ